MILGYIFWRPPDGRPLFLVLSPLEQDFLARNRQTFAWATQSLVFVWVHALYFIKYIVLDDKRRKTIIARPLSSAVLLNLNLRTHVVTEYDLYLSEQINYTLWVQSHAWGFIFEFRALVSVTVFRVGKTLL